MNIQYCAIYPDRKNYEINFKLLVQFPNKLIDILPDAIPWEETVRVFEPIGSGIKIYVHIDSISK